MCASKNIFFLTSTVWLLLAFQMGGYFCYTMYYRENVIPTITMMTQVIYKAAIWVVLMTHMM